METRDGTIRWGVIGAGNVFEHKSGQAFYSTPHSELAAVMRTKAAEAEETAARHGASRWHTEAAALVNDPEVNAVYIASPHHMHPEHVALAARAGKSVLCEKPIGVNPAEAQQAVDICRRKGVPLTVAYYRRFWPVTQTILKLLRDGAIGEVVTARVQVTELYVVDGRTWLLSRSKSGGEALANTGAHWVDLLRYWLGPVSDVIARCTWRATQGTPGDETDNTMIATLRMASGALATLTVSRRTPVSTNEIDISGTAGRLYSSSLSDGQLLVQRHGRDAEILHLPRQGAVHGELIAELVPRLLRGEPSPLPGEEAVAVWRIMQAAYRSAEEGARVQVKDEG